MKKKKLDKLLSSFKTIRTTILFLFSLLIVLSLFIFLCISIIYTKNIIITNSTEYTSQLVRQVNADIDSYIQYMKNIAAILTHNSDVQSYFLDDNQSEKEMNEKRNSITTELSTLMNSQPDIRNIGIYHSKDRYIFNSGTDTLNPYVELEKLDWYQETLSSDETTTLSSSHVQNLIDNSYKWVITLSHQLVNPKTDENSGFVFIDLNYTTISNLCKDISLGKHGYVFILDNKGNIVYHPKQQLIYSNLKTECIDKIMSFNEDKNSFITYQDGEKRLYTLSTSKKTGWTVVGVTPIKELNKLETQTQLTYTIIALLLFLIAILLSDILSRKITEPIKTLQNAMNKVEQGDFNAQIPVIEQNEIGSLSRTFNVMANRIDYLIKENTEVERQKRKSELKALQSQIKPHFLYNTLDSIIWMAEVGKNEEVVLMTSALAKLFRQSINNDEEIVTIRQEIEYVNSYLTIQKMRYKETLDYHINVDEEILDYKIVKLIIQPIVENAIYHGLKYKNSKGNIWIDGYLDDKDIYLVISDDGVGMSEEQLAHIFDIKPATESSTGVGINNIQSRLHLYYAEAYGLDFESDEGHGTTVYIHIPAVKNMPQEDIYEEKS